MSRKAIIILVISHALLLLFTMFVAVDSSSRLTELFVENYNLKKRLEALEVYAHVQDLKLEERVERTEKSIENLADRVYSED